MSSEKLRLEKIRCEIDEIDKRIHDLIMQRAKIVSRVKAAKATTGSAIYRPGREVEILKALFARHNGDFPRSAIHRIWREIISASVVMQDNFSCAVWDGAGGVFNIIARAHFGSATSLKKYPTTARVLNAVSKGDSTVGLLPSPKQGEQMPWWTPLCGENEEELIICARTWNNNLEHETDSLIVSKSGLDDPEAEQMFFGFIGDGTVSISKLLEYLNEAGLAVCNLFTAESPDVGGTYCLAEIEGSNDVYLQVKKGNFHRIDGVSKFKYVGSCSKKLEEANE